VEFADVFQPVGEAGVDVVTLDAVPVASGIAGHEVLASPPVVAPEPMHHELHHVTLAMVRWRGVGVNEQLHAANRPFSHSRLRAQRVFNAKDNYQNSRRRKVFS
jgi:hypothetical protein